MNNLHLLDNLIEYFRRFQGIGQKSSQRLVYQMLDWSREDILQFAKTIEQVSYDLSFCSQCNNISLHNQLCNICSDHQRHQNIICIVPTIRELNTIDRVKSFRGLYHVLGGVLSPLDGIGPDHLNIRSLLIRLQTNDVDEIILALSPSTEGEATTLYLVKLLKDIVPKISRLAFGLSVGSDIDQTDELTLTKALEGRLSL